MCESQGLPLELDTLQLKSYLWCLHRFYYSPLTVRYRWNPIVKIMDSLDIDVPDEVHELFEVVMDNAVDCPDHKISVNVKFLQQQFVALSKIVKGYELKLARAVLAVAWAGQLRVSEYTSKTLDYVYTGYDHNLSAQNVAVQHDGITLIFLSSKNSSKRQERFLEFDKVPIPGFKQIIDEYEKVRNKDSPIYFCKPDGSNLTPNNVADWIELSTLFTDWAGLRVTSHC